jgi:dTDP-4-dehydrorhamnose reductase
MKKKILVFGVTGLLGTSIEKIFKKDKNYKFIGCSHRDIDITNHKKLKKLLQKHRPNFVINTVALIGINFCEKNPEKTMNVNAFSVYNLAKICKSLNITLVQISTHAVFDGIKKKPYDENDQPNPINIYGHAKLVGEYFVKMNLKNYYILRMPTMYGPRRNKSLGFVDKMINNMKLGKDLKIAGDRIDSPSYTLTISKKIKKLITKKKYGIHHISDKGAISYYEFIKELSKMIGFKGKIQKVKDKEFPSAAPNPLRVSISSKNGTGVFWKKALKSFINEEKIKC